MSVEDINATPGNTDQKRIPTTANVKFYEYKEAHILQMDKVPSLAYNLGPLQSYSFYNLNDSRFGKKREIILNEGDVYYKEEEETGEEKKVSHERKHVFHKYGLQESVGWDIYDPPQIFKPGYFPMYNETGGLDYDKEGSAHAYEKDKEQIIKNPSDYIYGNRSKADLVKNKYIFLFRKCDGGDLTFYKEYQADEKGKYYAFEYKDDQKNALNEEDDPSDSVILPVFNTKQNDDGSKKQEDCEYFACLSHYPLSQDRIAKIEEDTLIAEKRLTRIYITADQIDKTYSEITTDADFTNFPDNCSEYQLSQDFFKIYLIDYWAELDRRLDKLANLVEVQQKLLSQESSRMQLLNYTDNILRAWDDKANKEYEKIKNYYDGLQRHYQSRFSRAITGQLYRSYGNNVMLPPAVNAFYSDPTVIIISSIMTSIEESIENAKAWCRNVVESFHDPRKKIKRDLFNIEKEFFEDYLKTCSRKADRLALDILDWLRRDELHVVQDEIELSKAKVSSVEESEPEEIEIDALLYSDMCSISSKIMNTLRLSVRGHDFFGEVLFDEENDDIFNVNFFKALFVPVRKSVNFVFALPDKRINPLRFEESKKLVEKLNLDIKKSNAISELLVVLKKKLSLNQMVLHSEALAQVVISYKHQRQPWVKKHKKMPKDLRLDSDGLLKRLEVFFDKNIGDFGEGVGDFKTDVFDKIIEKDQFKRVQIKHDQDYFQKKFYNLLEENNKSKFKIEANLEELKNKDFFYSEFEFGTFAKAFGAAFECVNVAISVSDAMNDASAKNLLLSAGSIVDLLDTLRSFRVIEEITDDIFIKLFGRSVGKFLPIVSGIIDASVALIDLYAAAKRGEKDIVFANAVLFAGSIAGVIGAIVGMKATAAAALAGVATPEPVSSGAGAIVLIGIALMVIGYTMVFLFTDTPIEHWMRFGPWGVDKHEGDDWWWLGDEPWMIIGESQKVKANVWRFDDQAVVNSYFRILNACDIECNEKRKVYQSYPGGSSWTCDSLLLTIKPSGVYSLNEDKKVYLEVEVDGKGVAIPMLSGEKVRLKNNNYAYLVTEDDAFIKRDEKTKVITQIQLTLYEPTWSYNSISKYKGKMIAPAVDNAYCVSGLFKRQIVYTPSSTYGGMGSSTYDMLKNRTLKIRLHYYVNLGNVNLTTGSSNKILFSVFPNGKEFDV